MSTELRFTVKDLDLLSENGCRYEVIDGELYVSTQPHWRHQGTCSRIVISLGQWNAEMRAGEVLIAPGIIFAADEAVAPDIVWVTRETLNRIVGEDGKLHAAPDLVIEVLSAGGANEERDRELKLKLYSRRGVREYWIVDWQEPSIQIYRREELALRLIATLYAADTLTSPLLPGFAAIVQELCATPA